MKTLNAIDKLGLWIKDSPKVIVLVAVSGIIGSLLTVPETVLTLMSTVEERAKKPRVEISGITTTKRWALTNLGQVFFSQGKYSIDGPLSLEEYNEVSVPFLNMKLQFLNPSKNKTTFMNCVVKASFLNNESFESMGYVETAHYMSGSKDSGTKSYYLNDGEAKTVDFLFFFLPTDTLKNVWDSNSAGLDINRTTVNCENEFGQPVNT